MGLARPAGFEPTTCSFGGCHSIQLSYGRTVAMTRLAQAGRRGTRALGNGRHGEYQPVPCFSLAARSLISWISLFSSPALPTSLSYLPSITIVVTASIL